MKKIQDYVSQRPIGNKTFHKSPFTLCPKCAFVFFGPIHSHFKYNATLIVKLGAILKSLAMTWTKLIIDYASLDRAIIIERNMEPLEKNYFASTFDILTLIIIFIDNIYIF